MMPSEPPRSARTSAIVWLIDDSPLQAEMARRAIARKYEVTVFSEGTAMIEALAAQPPPDLLVLDWQMPGLSGLEVCQFIRETRDAAELPILILTGTAAAENLVGALEAGANDFVVKPFSEPELQARVTALLRNKALHVKLSETEQRLRVEADFRERFIGMLAHDLRQPLNSFVLANQSIAAAGSGDSAPLLAMQRRAADRMVRMVNELLDFTRSRPESGMPIFPRPMNLATLAEKLLEEVRVGNPQHRFELEVDGSCEGSWDADRLAQLCSNLLGNAIEHGAPDTPITVLLRREPEAVVLSVSNQGEPIPSQLIPALFEPFRRGRGAVSRSGGVGLGLHIVSEIARAHGGTVEAHSDSDGTVFVVVVPTAAGALLAATQRRQ